MTGRALFSAIFFITFASTLWGQGDNNAVKIPINRQLFHDNINKEKRWLLGSDGKQDEEFSLENNPDISRLATAAINNQVDAIRFMVETDESINQRLKSGYLVGLANMLNYMRTGWRKKEVKPSHFAQIFSVYKKLIEVNTAGESIMPYVQHFPYDIAYTATLPRIFEENPEYGQLKDLLLIKYVKEYPNKGFYALSKYPTGKHTDSLIKALGRQFPQQLYSYAQDNSKLSYEIKTHTDDFVKTVVGLAAMKSGMIYFPFLDNLVKGKITIAELDAAKNDRVKYYRLLVRTQMDYSRRALKGDIPIGFSELTAWLKKKASDEFVNEINALHEEPDAVRFRCLENLTAPELYYLAILTDGLIYTSSYTNGVFPRMMSKANNRGDSLLQVLAFDRYRKFIRQAAGYNKLQTFLATFSNKQDAINLMAAFVNGLEKSKGLEDGVDVADSYASLYETLPELAKQMLMNVKSNYQRNARANNKRGVAIYNILDKLFLSANPSKNIDLTKELGIPPVYSIPFNSFTNEKGEIITQMFFYGDEDGMTDFDIFVRTFTNDPKWRVDQSNSKYVVAKSTSGVPVYVYANRPLPNTDDEDFVAQNAMQEYLEKNNLSPTVTFHRGHSYHAPTSVSYLTPTSKVVFMGSCGGFFLIDSILKKSSDAHIISSKQTGYRNINLPFIQIFLETLRQHKDVDWIPFWKEFRAAANITGMEDYIPPYKNLGALFIKAYKREMGEEEI